MNLRFLLAILFLVTIACSEEITDSNPPLIEIVSPSDGDSIVVGDTFTFIANFSDESELKSFKLDIHSAEGHQHKQIRTLEQAWPFIYEGSFPNGVQSYTQELSIVVPSGTSIGEYHLVVYCTDIHGNEATKYIELEILFN